MSTIGLYQELKQKLNSWEEKHIKCEGCEFYVNIKESITGGQFYFEEHHHIKVEVVYIGIKGNSTFFFIQQKIPVFTLSELDYARIEDIILKELDNVLENGKLDKVKDGTFNGWNT